MAGKKHPVWDLSIRLFHWLLVIGIVTQFVTMKVGDGAYTEWHFRSGFIILGLMLYRLIWGMVGSSTARFRHCLYRPSAVWAYAKELFKRDYNQHIGHNPLGGLSALAMMLLVIMMAVSGLFISDDILWDGPLIGWVSSDWSDWLHDVHQFGEKLLLVLILLHVFAILYYRFWKRTNLVAPMITGNAEIADVVEAPVVSTRSGWIGVVLLVICAAISYGVFVYWL